MAQVDKQDSKAILESVETVVDTGARVQETAELLLEFIDDERAAKQFVGYSKRPRRDIYSGLSAFPLYDYKRSNGDSDPVLLESDVTEAIRADDVADMMVDVGIDISVVNPTMNLGLAEMDNDRFAVALASAYNDWLVDELDGHENLVGNLIVAPQEPAQAAEEIDRVAGEDSIVGVHMPATGLTPPPGHKFYDPIYEAAQAHEFPITMYSTVGIKSFHQLYYSSMWYAEDFTYHPSFVHMRNLASMMFEGVPVKFPDLDFVFQGGGIGYVPYFIQRLDDHYLELGYEIPVLDRLPSSYAKDRFYWGTAPLGKASRSDYHERMIQMIGTDNVVYSSAVPHPISDRPEDFHETVGEQLDDGSLNAVLGATAKELYGL
jgi:predicted TIM-barrel fold metal-dependent hydrolase